MKELLLKEFSKLTLYVSNKESLNLNGNIKKKATTGYQNHRTLQILLISIESDACPVLKNINFRFMLNF